MDEGQDYLVVATSPPSCGAPATAEETGLAATKGKMVVATVGNNDRDVEEYDDDGYNTNGSDGNNEESYRRVEAALAAAGPLPMAVGPSVSLSQQQQRQQQQQQQQQASSPPSRRTFHSQLERQDNDDGCGGQAAHAHAAAAPNNENNGVYTNKSNSTSSNNNNSLHRHHAAESSSNSSVLDPPGKLDGFLLHHQDKFQYSTPPPKKHQQHFINRSSSSSSRNHHSRRTGDDFDDDDEIGDRDNGRGEVTIQAYHHPSPDKTATSSISWSQSPDVVTEFPQPQPQPQLPQQQQRQEEVSYNNATAKRISLKPTDTHNQYYYHSGSIEQGRNSDDGIVTGDGEGRGTTTTGRGEVGDDDNEDSFDNLIQVVIESTRSKPTSFHVPISLMLQREIEMQETARVHMIGRERWSSSRLFRMWKMKSQKMSRRQQQQQQQQAVQLNPTTPLPPSRDEDSTDSNNEMKLHVTPEVSLNASSPSSTRFRWRPWLTLCIRSYYNTGTLRIPNECRGDDLLLALEYFGVLTASPDTFVFESRDAYERVQSWSRYFTNRETLKEQLLDDYDEVEEQADAAKINIHTTDRGHVDVENSAGTGRSRLWVLRPFEQQDQERSESKIRYLVENETARCLVSSRSQDCLYDLFVDRHPDETMTAASTESHILTMELPARLRRDFAEFLKQSLPPRTAVYFEMKEVMVAGRDKFKALPVIQIAPDEGDAPKSFHDMLCKREQENSVSSDRISERNKQLHGGVHDVDLIARASASGQTLNADHDASLGQLEKLNLVDHSNNNTAAFNISRNSADYSPNTKALLGEGISSASDTATEQEQLPVRILFPDGKQEDNGTNQEARASNSRQSRSAAFAILHQDATLTEAVSFVAHDAKKAFDRLATMPVKYINTDLGDLRSVTSILTEPVIDPSCGSVGDGTHFRKHRKFDMTPKALSESNQLTTIDGVTEGINPQFGKPDPPPVMKSIIDSEIPYSSHGLIRTPPRPPRKVDFAPSFKEKNDSSSIAEPQDLPQNGREETDSANMPVGQALSRSSEEINENLSATNKDNGSWGRFIATVCDSIVPAPGSNDLCQPPSHNFPPKVMLHSDNDGCTQKDGCLQSTLTDPDEFMEHAKNEFFYQAKRIGEDLSVSLNDVLNAILEDHGEVDLKRIPEERSTSGSTDMMIPSDEEALGRETRFLSSSDVGRVEHAESGNEAYRIKYPERSRFRKTSSKSTKKNKSKGSPTTVKSKSAKKSLHGRTSPLSSEVDASIPKTLNFDSDSLFGDDGSSLPPRDRSSFQRNLDRTRNKLPAARRRETKTTETPEELYRIPQSTAESKRSKLPLSERLGYF